MTRSLPAQALRYTRTLCGRLIWHPHILLSGLLLSQIDCGASPPVRPDAHLSSSQEIAEAERSASGYPVTDFDRRTGEVRQAASRLDHGAALLISYKNVSSGSVQTLAYIDSTPPERKNSAWIIQARAYVDSEVISTFVLALPRLGPGSYRCQAEGPILGAALGESRWDPKAHDTSWTANGGGHCELALRRTGSGDMEGTFSGRLETNDGKSFVLVERGYIYVKAAPDEGDGGSDTTSSFKEGVSCHRRGDYACAVRNFAGACKAGVGDACFNLGIMFENGQGVGKDLDQALSFYERSCKMGVESGGIELVKTLKTVCDHGSASACGLLGAIFLDGEVCGRFPFTPQLKAGRELVCRSCADGFDEACKVAQRMETRCERTQGSRR